MLVGACEARRRGRRAPATSAESGPPAARSPCRMQALRCRSPWCPFRPPAAIVGRRSACVCKLELRTEQRCQVFDDVLAQRARLPGGEVDAARLGQVSFENLYLLGGELAVVEVQVGLVVEAKRAVVEVRRSARDHELV